MAQYGTYTAEATVYLPREISVDMVHTAPMTTKSAVLAERIASRLTATGLSERAASIKATGQPDTIRFVRTRGVMPSWDKIVQLAEALGTSPTFLLGETNDPDPRAWAQTRVVVNDMMDFQDWQDGIKFVEAPPWVSNPEAFLPRYGSRPEQNRALTDGGTAHSLSVTRVEPHVSSMVHRPPALQDSKNAYAFLARAVAVGVEPAFESESRLIVCDPSWPPIPKDEVAIHLRAKADAPGTDVIVRKLQSIERDCLYLATDGVASGIRIERTDVIAVHRVASMSDLLAR